MQKSKDTEVIVLGAGMSGLAAARALGERGLRVVVLEAQKRVGGRILSQQTESGVIELGAEFVHGRPPELWALIEEAGVETVERDGAMLREGFGGGLENEAWEDDESMFAPLEQLEDFAGEDVAFWDWLKASEVPESERAALLGYVEGFNAADARRISVKSLGVQQKAEDTTEGDRMWHVRGGYAQLTDYLAKRVVDLGGEIRLGCEVLGVRWSEDEVCVETSQGDLSAARCIVTLPLGVLQRVNKEHGLWMEPEPAAIAHAQRLAMGDAERFTMVFRERWWAGAPVLEVETLEAMSFVFTPQRLPPVWWTGHPEAEASPTLTAWVGGPRAKAFRGKSAEELGVTACSVLAEVFGIAESTIREALVATHRHDWSGDVYSRGAYTYVPVGAIDASPAMTEPERGMIFFAGEHTDVTGHWGTVHAALRSGLRAAAQVLGEDEASPA